MKIVIEGGKPKVQFKASEKTALTEAAKVCSQLSQWLKDVVAEEAGRGLEEVIDQYITEPEQVEAVS